MSDMIERLRKYAPAATKPLVAEIMDEAATALAAKEAELAAERAKVERLREALIVLRDLQIVENDGPNVLHLRGETYTGPAVDWLFSVVRKIKKIACATLAETQPDERTDNG